MCPPFYHHNGFMASPELEPRMYGSILWEKVVLEATRVLKLWAVSDA